MTRTCRKPSRFVKSVLYREVHLSEKRWRKHKIGSDGSAHVWCRDCCRWEWMEFEEGAYSMIRVEGRDHRVHRLVLELFVGPCPDGMEACHNNGISSDNRVENLRWGTRKENQNDRNIHGTASNRGNHGKDKVLTASDVLEIRRLREIEGLTHSVLARMFGVTASAVSMIIARKNWNNV